MDSDFTPKFFRFAPRRLLAGFLGCWLCVATAGAESPQEPTDTVPTNTLSTDAANGVGSQLIDRHIDQRLRDAGVAANDQVTDAGYLRRVSLDLLGRQPTLAELEQFASDPRPDKRAHLVDQLMSSPGFYEYQAAELDQLLMGDVNDSLHGYLTEALESGKTWDKIFADVILARDTKEPNPAAAYYRSRINDLDKLTNSVSVSFFGVNISCAQCHDHPLAFEWTQGHFYGMKSFFGRMFQNGKKFGERDYGAVTYKDTEGNSYTAQLMFLTGEIAPEPPWWNPSDEEKKAERKRLDEQKKSDQPPSEPAFSRRAQLVRLALSPQNRHYFSRSIVNHTWERLVGRGIVSPVDQMHPANEPSHPELLAELARQFAEDGYDLQKLIRAIVLSKTYARSSAWNAGEQQERPGEDYFAVAQIRPLTPRQYAGSLMLAATSPAKFRGDNSADVAAQVARSGDFMVRHLEYPTNDFQVSVTEALYFSNGEEIQNRLLRTTGDSLIKHLVDQTAQDQTAAIETAFRNTLCRAPDTDELAAAQQYLGARQDRVESAWQQMVWALIMSSEFRFNH